MSKLWRLIVKALSLRFGWFLHLHLGLLSFIQFSCWIGILGCVITPRVVICMVGFSVLNTTAKPVSSIVFRHLRGHSWVFLFVCRSNLLGPTTTGVCQWGIFLLFCLYVVGERIRCGFLDYVAVPPRSWLACDMRTVGVKSGSWPAWLYLSQDVGPMIAGFDHRSIVEVWWFCRCRCRLPLPFR